MRKKVAIPLFVVGAVLLYALLLIRASSGPEFVPFQPPRSVPDPSYVESTIKPGGDMDGAESDTADPSPPIGPIRTTTYSEQPTFDQPGVIRPESTVTIDNKEYPLRTYVPLALPNDPQANQWWVSNAKLEQAWEIPRGNHETLLAIIDTGYALQHEEFVDRWDANAAETGPTLVEQPSALNCADRALPLDAGCNLIDDDEDTIVDNEVGTVTYQNPSRLNCTDQLKVLDKSCNRADDDGNGLIDDVTGWDFINYDNSPQAGELNSAGTGTTHGTLVAGVAAATGNNAKGIAGSDWNTKILPLQALDDDSYGNTLSVGRAIRYATARGADVISISLGSAYADPYVEEAVRVATAAGIVVVAAAGNDGCECILYPAKYPEVVAVGALNTSSQRASFSAWGSNLDIMAPGTQITAPTWQVANATSAYASNVAGTSFAAPMVGGMMTRLLSHQPTAKPLQLIAAITENTNRLGLAVNAPHDAQLGFGTLNAQAASLRLTTPRVSQHLYAFTPVSKGNYLTPDTPAETGSYIAYQCEGISIGGTPIHELIRVNSSFFTVSNAENAKAITSGYVSTRFAYACLQQPHDTMTTVRGINIFKEFRNIYKPL